MAPIPRYRHATTECMGGGRGWGRAQQGTLYIQHCPNSRSGGTRPQIQSRTGSAATSVKPKPSVWSGQSRHPPTTRCMAQTEYATHPSSTPDSLANATCLPCTTTAWCVTQAKVGHVAKPPGLGSCFCSLELLNQTKTCFFGFPLPKRTRGVPTSPTPGQVERWGAMIK